jgi:hypothetical protein
LVKKDVIVMFAAAGCLAALLVVTRTKKTACSAHGSKPAAVPSRALAAVVAVP